MSPRVLVSGFGLLLVVSSPWTVNDLLQAAAGCVTVLIGVALLRPSVVPVLPLAIGYQWLQVSVATLHANVLGIGIEQLLPAGDARRATYLGLAVLSIATVSSALGSLQWAPVDVEAVRGSLLRTDRSAVIKVYATTLLVVLALRGAIGVSSPLSQIVQGVEGLRWAGLMLLIASCLVQRRGAGWILAVLSLEVAIGLSGFFAGFAVPLLFALLAYLTVFSTLARAQRLAAVAVVLVLVVLGVFWNAVKSEYRRTVAGPGESQTVSIGLGERYSTLGELALDTLYGDLGDTLAKAADRVAYVQYFGIVLDRVPAALPHRQGELLVAAVEHVLTPRVLFPDKAPLPADSVLTAQYTGDAGLVYMTGTSISLGYVAEGYIDFGVPGVLLMGGVLASVMVGVLCIFRKLSADPAVALVLTCSTLIGTRLIEVTLAKLLGGSLAVCLVGCALLLVGRAWIRPFLHGEARRDPVSVEAST